MDPATRPFYEACLRNEFLKRTGNAFQEHFADIMERRYPGDFQRMRPWGNIGDQGNDGYWRSRRLLFQVYAPREMEGAKLATKVKEDFAKALEYWEDHFRTWVLVGWVRSSLEK